MLDSRQTQLNAGAKEAHCVGGEDMTEVEHFRQPKPTEILIAADVKAEAHGSRTAVDGVMEEKREEEPLSPPTVGADNSVAASKLLTRSVSAPSSGSLEEVSTSMQIEALQDTIGVMHEENQARLELLDAKLEAFIAFTTERLDAIGQIGEQLNRIEQMSKHQRRLP